MFHHLPTDLMAEWTHGRYYLWATSIRIIEESPFFGHGVGSFPVLVSIFREQVVGFNFGIQDVTGNAHNIALEMIVEIGIIGFIICLLAFIWLILYPLRRRKKSSPKITPFQSISLISFVGIFLFSLIGEIANITVCTIFSWLSLSIYVWHSYDTRRAIVIQLPQTKHIPILATILITTLFLVFSIKQGAILYSNYLTAHVLKTVPESDSPRAIPVLNLAIQLDSNNIQALYMQSWAYLHDGNLAKSEYLADLVIKKDPFYSNIRFEKGVHAFLRKNYLLAIQELKQAMRKFPKEYDSGILLAKAFYLSNSFEESIAICDFLIQLNYLQNEVLNLKKIAKNKWEAHKMETQRKGPV